ncbi:hypothetical protein CFP66_05785 [Pseudonocardia sp. MH-G8]|nr:hypothetical protein CFP66_05785 [Pseudonocardia sp. MH-G8]
MAHRLAAARRMFGSAFVLLATAATFLTVGVPVTKTAALSLAVSAQQVDAGPSGLTTGADALGAADPYGPSGPDTPGHVAVVAAEPLLPNSTGARGLGQAAHDAATVRAGAGWAWSARGPPGPA